MMRTCLVIASFLALASAEPFLTLQRESVRMRECPEDSESCIKAKVDFQTLKNSDELELPNKFKLKRLSYTEKDDYIVATYGYDNPHGANGYLLFSRDYSWASGSILDDVSLKRFALAPCDDHEGCHIWSEVKSEKAQGVSDMEVSSVRGFEASETERLMEMGQTDSTTVVNVTITMLVTTEAQARLGANVVPFAYSALEGIRFTASHSKIPINFQLRCIELMSVGIANYSNSLNSLWQSFYGNREAQKRADFTYLLTSNVPTPYAYAPGYLAYKVTLSVYNVDNGADGFWFNFLMSTIIGCMANDEVTTNTKFPYGHAFWIKPPVNSGLRTLLASGSTGYGQAISYYSNPNVNYRGYIIGTAEKNNNARVFTDQRFIMAAVGDESGTCSQPLPTTTPKPFTCKDYFIRDGFCDDTNNVFQCQYDGGDCCVETNINPSYKEYCDDCICKMKY